MSRRPSVGERIADGEAPARALEGRYRGPLREDAFASPLHDERVAAVLGIALATAFTVCFATGLVSHFIQNPLHIGALSQPTAPASLYRVTQGLHITAGLAAIPLLLVKLWTVYPRLFRVPPIASVAHAVERVLVVFLVGGSLFILFTGVMAIAQWVPWEFRFRQTHFWTAWIVIGALVAHIGAKLPITRRALGRVKVTERAAPAGGDGTLTRRGLVASAFAGAGVVALTTAGQTLAPLKGLALLSPRRPDVGPQGIPVNRTAKAAGVLERAQAADWTLTVDGDVQRRLALSLDELRAMQQHEVTLPIACVEGWSASARWSGVRVADLLERAGAAPGASAAVESLEQAGLRRSRLSSGQAAAAETLLALAIDGEPLHPDHGFPCRLIGPNRPGVQQTKWVTRLEVGA
jgi:hypothetical protein